MTPKTRIPTGNRRKIVSKSPDSIHNQLLDNAYNTFIRRILWRETAVITISEYDSGEIANAMVSIIEMVQECLENGAIPLEIYTKMNRFGAEIDEITKAIRLYNSEIHQNTSDIVVENGEIAE